MYNHPKRLTQKAIETASVDLRAFGREAMILGGFSVDDITVSVQKGGGFVTFVNALGTIAQHKVAANYLRSKGAYFGFSYKFPNDPFTKTVLMYPATTPDREADRESDMVRELIEKRKVSQGA
jgi:hypothetical protein